MFFAFLFYFCYLFVYHCFIYLFVFQPDISGERQKDPTSKPSHPFCPRVPQVSGRHVLLSILPQSSSGMWPASPPFHSAPEPLRSVAGNEN